VKLRLTMLALALPLAACTSDLGSGPLSGNWGGTGMQVSATPGSIVMTLTCGANVRVAHGVLLDGAGGFSVLDSLRGRLGGGAPRDTLPGGPAFPVVPALITGHLAGDVLTVSLALNYTAGTTTTPITFDGKRGQAGNFGTQICRL
jgi:hypothetical protein